MCCFIQFFKNFFQFLCLCFYFLKSTKIFLKTKIKKSNKSNQIKSIKRSKRSKENKETGFKKRKKNKYALIKNVQSYLKNKTK